MNRAAIERDHVPSSAPPRPGVSLVWHEEVDPRRLRRVAEILLDVLDNPEQEEPSNG